MDTKSIIQLTKGCESEEAYTIYGCNAFGQKFIAENAFVEKDRGVPCVEDDKVYFGFGEKLDCGLFPFREIIAPYRTKYPTYEENGKEVINERILDYCLFIESVVDSLGNVVVDNSEFIKEHEEEMQSRLESFELKNSDDPNYQTTIGLIGQPSVFVYPDERVVKGVTAFVGKKTDCGDPIVETIDGTGIACAFLTRGVNVYKLGEEPEGVETPLEYRIDCV